MLENTSVGFVPEDDGWRSISIIWSCLSTWFVCLYVIFPVNIPAPSGSWTVRTLRQAGFMILGTLAPEFIAAIACTQRREAPRPFLDYQELWRASNPQCRMFQIARGIMAESRQSAHTESHLMTRLWSTAFIVSWADSISVLQTQKDRFLSIVASCYGS
jgi:hypothetical protein